MVSGVKDQGSCGSCWAFAATGALESAFLLRDKTTQLLSEQNLVDCSRKYGNQGCDGGWMDSAYDYIQDNGISTSDAYPYTARNGKCKDEVARSIKMASYVDINDGCESLRNALQSRPVAVAVDASAWGSYKSGIISQCGTTINHGVLVVGLTDSYWKVKNSWGTLWGESGFVRLAPNNICAICNFPSYPIL
jgi:C1A family cysteine protease